MKKIILLRPMVALVCLIAMIAFSSCDKDLSDPPMIKVFVDDIEVTTNDPIAIVVDQKIEYRFEVSANSSIVDMKVVVFDLSVPDNKKGTEMLVGGLSNSTKEVVKGTFYPTDDSEMMLIVKDQDGNEAAKSFSVVFE